VRLLELDAPAVAASCGNYQRHPVIIVGQGRMHVEPKGAPGDLHELAEEALDGVPASVVARQLAAPADVPQNVLGEEVVQRREVPLENAAYPSLIRATLEWSAMAPPSISHTLYRQ
jgi:hypothetical protein